MMALRRQTIKLWQNEDAPGIIKVIKWTDFRSLEAAIKLIIGLIRHLAQNFTRTTLKPLNFERNSHEC
uniref:Uncharacterized protein n=1 Tax=Vespula pensylvanica TaxID=30213 RepID=A0A834NWT4_VESPE|nr:hypothetical protein H0235_010295 [Vespula pensylvanica]